MEGTFDDASLMYLQELNSEKTFLRDHDNECTSQSEENFNSGFDTESLNYLESMSKTSELKDNEVSGEVMKDLVENVDLNRLVESSKRKVKYQIMSYNRKEKERSPLENLNPTQQLNQYWETSYSQGETVQQVLGEINLNFKGTY